MSIRALGLSVTQVSIKDKVDISENKNQQVSKLSINTDVLGVLPLYVKRKCARVKSSAHSSKVFEIDVKAMRLHGPQLKN